MVIDKWLNLKIEEKLATYQLTIDGNNMSTIYISAYKENEELILHSSQNEHTYFKSGSFDVFDKLLVSSNIFKSQKTE